jgi:hypothetical protein
MEGMDKEIVSELFLFLGRAGREGKNGLTRCQKVTTSTRTLQIARSTPMIAEDDGVAVHGGWA